MKEDDKILKVVTRIFMAIFVVLFIAIMIRFSTKNILVDIMNIDNPIVQEIAETGSSQKNKTIDINWSKEYPFENNQTNQEENSNLIDKYTNRIAKAKKQIENYTSNYLFGYEKIVELAKRYEKSINWNLIALDDENTPIFLGNNIVTTINGKKDYTNLANKLVEFNKYLEEKGIELIYVQPPVKIENTTSGGLMDIYKDFTRENTNAFINVLNENNVNTLDLRIKMDEEKINYLEAFFETDHHWRPETGLWATKQIANKMNQDWKMNINLNLYNMERYNIEIYENALLGSQGRKITLGKVNAEDINIITPIYETNLTVEIPDLEYKKTGSLKDTLIDIKKVHLKNLYADSAYSVYSYADRPVKKVTNNLIEDNEKILILKDSFADVVMPYLSLGTQNIYEVDQRYFDGSIKSFIEKNGITKVIVMYYPGSLHDDVNNKLLFNYN